MINFLTLLKLTDLSLNFFSIKAYEKNDNIDDRIIIIIFMYMFSSIYEFLNIEKIKKCQRYKENEIFPKK